MAMEKTRLTVYATGAVGVVGIFAAAFGLAEFDHATGMIDFAPFNAYALAAAVPTFVAPFLASVALWFGWGKK
jgi:hypothetical protein